MGRKTTQPGTAFDPDELLALSADSVGFVGEVDPGLRQRFAAMVGA